MREQAKRSLKASSAGISQANKAVRTFATKIDFAAEVEISRSTVHNFFAGKPVKREKFHKICQVLKLPWREVADLPEEPEENEFSKEKSEREKGNDIDVVEEVRQKGHASIQHRCGMMRVLDMSQPLKLNDIYTNVNILEKISGRRLLEVADLLKVYVSDQFERPELSRIAQDRVLGLEAVKKYSKIIVLGKPGAGKTTFLKHLALQCSSGELQADRVPIFITLKDFAETQQRPSLLEYITEQLSTEGIADTSVAEQLLSQGKMLILLDGLDEVKEIDSQRVLQSIRSFYKQFHANHFIITRRIATREYTFEQFTEIEIADFDCQQIASFAIKWFAVAPTKIDRFLSKLEANRSIQDLATNPLLLTLLCLMFSESGEFPSNRSELYKEGVDVLLKKWDTKRNISREQIYKDLSVQHKEKLLSKIALVTFERGEYCFRQKEIEQHIADYLRNLLGASTELEPLQIDSEAVLKSIEAQHGLLVERAFGIYSFSHLTFHEYFTAREIATSSDAQALETALNHLVSRVTEKRWREVFLLTAGMLQNADYMLQLMKQKIDHLISQDDQLQAFLTWVNQKFRAVSASYKPVTVRAFYFDLALARILALVGSTLDLARALDRNFTRNLERTLAFDLTLDRALGVDQVVDRTRNPNRAFERVVERALAYARVLEPMLEQTLQQLKEQLPELGRDRKKFKQWWEASGGAWTEQLRAVMISERNLGHDWQFSEQQREALKQYYDANQLLVDCLNSNCYITPAVREEIEETLLLPIAELPQTPICDIGVCITNIERIDK